MICRKNGPNGVADATYGGYHISYEVKKLMYEIPKSCSLVCKSINVLHNLRKTPHYHI